MQTPIGPTAPPSNTRILVVDDNPAIHQDFRKILCRPVPPDREFFAAKALLCDQNEPTDLAVAFEIDCASQGQDGLSMAQSAVEQGRPYAVAFVDIRMPPGWDGIETISRLWQIDPQLQVVICTAYSDYSWAHITQSLGHRDNLLILKKPFDNLEVLQLAHALATKWSMAQEIRAHLDRLGHTVSEQSRALHRTTAQLAQESRDRSHAEERFENAFRRNPVAMLICHLDTGHIVDVNESALRLVAREMNDVLEQDLGTRDFFEAGAAALLLERLRDSRSCRNVEATLLVPPDQRRKVLVSGDCFSIDQEWVTLLTIEDITDRLNLEAQLRQSQKMEAVGQLAAGVAHDFNNILTIILGNLSLVLQGHELTTDTDESVRQALAATERAANLTRQLLAFARKETMQRRPLQLRVLLSQITHLLHRLIGECVELEVRCSPDVRSIMADPCSLEQVLINLAVNARDAMPKGGRLIITAQNSTEPGEPTVSLKVTDTGCGMDRATQARVFEPFFTTKEVGKGTGMGLATVYGIIKQHNGVIRLESELHRGTTFEILLPAVEDSEVLPALTAEPPDEPELISRGETVLLAEDEPFLRDFVEGVLRRYGYRVVSAANGHEALELWHRENAEIDLLLTDMVMPGGISGKDLADRAKRDKPTLKVIYSSGYSFEVLGKDFQLEDSEMFLRKPYQSVDLLQTVRTCLTAPTHRRGRPILPPTPPS